MGDVCPSGYSSSAVWRGSEVGVRGMLEYPDGCTSLAGTPVSVLSGAVRRLSSDRCRDLAIYLEQ